MYKENILNKMLGHEELIAAIIRPMKYADGLDLEGLKFLLKNIDAPYKTLTPFEDNALLLMDFFIKMDQAVQKMVYYDMYTEPGDAQEA